MSSRRNHWCVKVLRPRRLPQDLYTSGLLETAVNDTQYRRPPRGQFLATTTCPSQAQISQSFICQAGEEEDPWFVDSRWLVAGPVNRKANDVLTVLWADVRWTFRRAPSS